MSEKKATIIIIGNEILFGKVVDQNASYLSRALRSLGVQLERVSFIPDHVETIAAEIRESHKQFDLTFSCGGIGPTHDDVTMEGIAQGLGKPLIQDPELLKILKEGYGRELNKSQIKMAEVPDGTDLIFSGILRVPVLCYDTIYIFPGIPELVVKKFEAVKERFRESPFFLNKIYLSEKEDNIAEILREALKKFPRLQLGSYPALRRADDKVLLTLESKKQPYLEDATNFLIGKLPLGSIVKIDKHDVQKN